LREDDDGQLAVNGADSWQQTVQPH